MTLKVTRDHFGRRVVFDQAEAEPDDGTLFKAVCHLFEKADRRTQQEILETLQNMAEAAPAEAAAVAEDARRRRARDTRARRLGHDGAITSGFAQRYPSASRIDVLPSESDFSNVRR